MKILSIETSCDETALSLIKASGDKKSPNFDILANQLYSQADKHADFGGVYPSLAKREHAKNLIPLLNKLLKESNLEITQENNFKNQKEELQKILEREPELFEQLIKYTEQIKKPDIDLITVTSGPGLEPALWVGINFAKALSLIWQIPVIPINHMEGHISSVLMNSNKINFPAIALLISGGHTELVLIKNWGQYEIIGQTKDDAIGEAFDKVARILGLPYPGGPEISRLAEEVSDSGEITLPRPMINSGDFNFSFSGIKTATLYLVEKLEKSKNLTKQIRAQIAHEFQNAVIEVIFKKTTDALREYKSKSLIIGGGVVANTKIKEQFQKLEKENISVHIPEINLATDNAVMIAIAGYLKSFESKGKINPDITADGNLKLN